MPNARSTNFRPLARSPRSSSARAYSMSASARNPGSRNSRPDRSSRTPRCVDSTRAARSATACRRASDPPQPLLRGDGPQDHGAVEGRLVVGGAVDGVGDEARRRPEEEVPGGRPGDGELLHPREPLVTRPDPDRRQGGVKVGIGRPRPGGDVARLRAGRRLARDHHAAGRRQVAHRLRRVALETRVRHVRSSAPPCPWLRPVPVWRQPGCEQTPKLFGHRALGGARDVGAAAVGEHHRHRVVVGVEADAGGAHVVGHDRVAPLFAQLAAGPRLQRRAAAELGRKADQERAPVLPGLGQTGQEIGDGGELAA